MSLIMDMVLGFAVAFFMLTAFHLVNGGELTTSVIGVDGQPHRRLTFLNKAGAKGALISLAAGVVIFVLNHYVVKNLNHKTIWLGWIALIVLLAGYGLLAMFWHKTGTELREGVVFAIIAVLPFFTIKALVGIVSAPWMNDFLERAFGLLPVVVVFVFIAFMIFDRIRLMRLEGNPRYKTILTATIAVIVTLLVLTLLVGLTGCSKNGGSGGESSSSQSEEMEKAKKDLTVPKLTAEDLEKLTVGKYKDVPETLLDSSLSPCDKERTEKSGFSDALTFGFSDTKDNTKMFKELEEEILRNPVYGVTLAKAVKDKNLGDKTIGNLNPWIGEMINKNNAGVFAWCEYRDAKKKTIYVTEEYRTYAATLCTFMERLVEQGTEKRQTIENWRLNDTVKNNDRAGVKANYQYKKDSFVLAYVLKSGEKVFEVGFNVHDKRPEYFEEEKPKATPESHQVEESKPASQPEYSEPEYSEPESRPESKPESSQPESKPESKPESSQPESKPESKPESSQPEPSKPESSTPYNKDPSKAPKKNTEPNDVSGPGPDTNNGKGATESTKDKPTNSTKYPSYEEYKKDMQEMSKVNQEQKTGKDNNEPTTKPEKSKSSETSVAVDNNGDNGTGNGGINTPTPQTSSAETVDGHKITDDAPGGAWGGPPD